MSEVRGYVARRILVPVNGSSTDDEAVRLACRLAKRQAGRVYVITILEVKRNLALDAATDAEVQRCETLLDHAEQIGTELDVDIETELIQAREAGPAIVDEVSEWRADLLVLGMPYRERFGEFHMGKTAPYVLRFASCRTLLFREPFQR
jgi:nucleotide-binding universal stress UspA family protein